ncbi:hypothetical protein Tco_1313000 [Tanacetum coccineum]
MLWQLCIPISSDSLRESVGSHVPRVILFGAIPAIIPEVSAEVPIVPVDPLVAPEDSLPPALELPLVSPFLCSDDSEADSDVLVLRWRDRVTSRSSSSSGSSSHDIFAPSSEFLVAPVFAPPKIRQLPCDFNMPGRLSFSIGPFRTILTGLSVVYLMLSVVNSSPGLYVLISFSLVLILDSSLDTSSGSPSDSLSDTSSVHSSGCDASGQTHSGSSTRVAQSRVIPRFISERSLDSSSLSAGPSRKICRSPTTSVPSSNPVSRSISPTHADLLPPRKRFKDSYSPEDSREEHMEIGIADAEAVVDLGIGDGAHIEDGIEMAVDPLVTGGIFESTRGDIPDLEGTLYDIVHYMSEVPLDRITEFKTAQRQLEAGQLMASRERTGLTDRIRRLGLENLKVRALLCIERDRVQSLRHHMVLSQEEFRQIRRDHDDARRRLRRLELFVERHLGFRP